MRNTLTAVELISAVIVMIAVLMQHRGTGLGGAFGGEDLSYRSRRGIEKFFYRLTVVSATAFLMSAVVQIII